MCSVAKTPKGLWMKSFLQFYSPISQTFLRYTEKGWCFVLDIWLDVETGRVDPNSIYNLNLFSSESKLDLKP